MHWKLFYNLIIKPSLVHLDNKSLFLLIHGVYLLLNDSHCIMANYTNKYIQELTKTFGKNYHMPFKNNLLKEALN